MLPVLTPAQMAVVDADAPEPTAVLVQRAGAAVAASARAMLGGTYGRHVVVVVGRGNNGADGRIAASLLRGRGVRVSVLEAGLLPVRLPTSDLLIDAAFGTGFRGIWSPPAANAPVLAVDLPSGVDGVSGLASGAPWRAERTVTFGALKPGLCFAAGRDLAGVVELHGLGLDCSGTDAWLVDDSDAATGWPRRGTAANKWDQAVWVIGGSPGMTGAPGLASTSALRSGAGYVRISVPGSERSLTVTGAPVEAVAEPLPMVGWDAAVLDGLGRFGALVIGPGLGRSEAARRAVLSLAANATVPMVLDGDALWALASVSGPVEGTAPVVMSPHDGEYTQLCGHPPGEDRIAAARLLAGQRNVVAVLKGPTTIVATPTGQVSMVMSGDQRLATAGTGDVLSGMIGALAAGGLDLAVAAGLAAHVHGLAGRAGPVIGTVASDVAAAIPRVLEHMFETDSATHG